MITTYFMTAENKEHLEKSQAYGYEKWNEIQPENRKLLRTIENGIYKVNVYQVPMGKGYWEYLLIQVLKNDVQIAEVMRNYSGGMFRILNHPNGNDYLFTGHDYQGYTVINLTQETMGIYVHDGYENGWGWCPIDLEDFDAEEQTITLYGCHWACPYEYRILDFKNPDVLPLPILRELDDDKNPYPEEDEEDGTERTEADPAG